MSWLPDWITGYDAENADRAAAADAELRRINQENRDRGLYDDATWGKIQKDYETEVSFDPGQQRDSIDDAFKEGLDQGAGNISGFISGAFNFVGKALSAVVLGIPFWVWLLVAGALFWKLGGLNMLKRKLTMR